MTAWLLVLAMTAASPGDCFDTLEAILADLDGHSGITWTAAGREYAATSLEALCGATPAAPAVDVEDPAQAEDASSFLGMEVKKAPEDSAGHKRLKKTH